MAVGTQDGKVILYDLRDFSKPILSGVYHNKAVTAAVKGIENSIKYL